MAKIQKVILVIWPKSQLRNSYREFIIHMIFNQFLALSCTIFWSHFHEPRVILLPLLTSPDLNHPLSIHYSVILSPYTTLNNESVIQIREDELSYYHKKLVRNPSL